MKAGKRFWKYRNRARRIRSSRWRRGARRPRRRIYLPARIPSLRSCVSVDASLRMEVVGDASARTPLSDGGQTNCN